MSVNDTKTGHADPTLKLTLRLMHCGEIAMGPGKADLLEAIQSTGSINAAGKSMNMSYRRAWLLVDVMNRSFIKPLVQAAKGGRHGGGAKLTPFGLEVLANYRKMDQAAKSAARAYLPLFDGLMAPADSVSQAETLPADAETE
ncbi:winged helix-turn-helix domain-containing protein [Methylomonas sp. UP202]|uniref:winged helix-turn-helix domain-containing protein n=1 Tax=unclassified Methylomonas TaxID=2608980 RepID=UPI002479D070|nr:winged helix-turn-helix domain-containing protein [Methylomonas sp. UP202]WGS85986.1 winged helix-turn-helix domain-containing protein [Methylomonas sp. UP202]